MEVCGQLHAPAEETAFGTYLIGGWVGPRVGLDEVAKRKTPAPVRNRTPVVQPVA